MIAAPYNKSEISIAEFFKMSFEERVEVCARLVSSNRIGECASISQPEGELLTAADIKKIGESCFSSSPSILPHEYFRALECLSIPVKEITCISGNADIKLTA